MSETMKRVKTKHIGVYYRNVERIGGQGVEKCFYITFKKDGRMHEEKVGRQYANHMTEGKAARVRAERIEGRRKSRKEIREEAKAKDERWTIDRLPDRLHRRLQPLHHRTWAVPQPDRRTRSGGRVQELSGSMELEGRRHRESGVAGRERGPRPESPTPPLSGRGHGLPGLLWRNQDPLLSAQAGAVYLWVRELAAEVSVRAGESVITPTSWRIAARQWLVTNKLIKIERSEKVSPHFGPKSAHN